MNWLIEASITVTAMSVATVAFVVAAHFLAGALRAFQDWYNY